MDPFKALIIDAIVGIGFPSLTIALSAEKAHIAQWITTGLGHGRHEWRREKLEHQPLEHLQMMYEGLCEEREIQSGIRAPVADEGPLLPEAPQWAKDLVPDSSNAH